MSDLLVTYKENEVIVSPAGYPTHTFRIVDSVPSGYEVWNIGSRHMPEGYLPLCRRSAVQPFPGGEAINVETLLAINTDGAHLILDAVVYGPGTPAEMERFIRKHQSAKPGSHYERAVKRKLRRIISENKDADFVLWNGNRVQIKRKLFEQYIDQSNCI